MLGRCEFVREPVGCACRTWLIEVGGRYCVSTTRYAVSSRLLVLDGEYSPLVRHPFEYMRSAVGERYPGPGHQILDRGGQAKYQRGAEPVE